MGEGNFNWSNEVLTRLISQAGLIALKLVLIIVLFFIIRALGKKLIGSAFEKYQKKNTVNAGRIRTLEKLSINVFSYALIFFTVVTALSNLGVSVTSIIAGAGVVGLAIGFGAQGLVSDVVTGFFVLLEKQIDVDDYVTVGGLDGVVEEVGLRTTQIRGFDGTLHFIPNREITTVSNHSRGNMRAMVDIGISYDDDIDRALSVIQEVCDKVSAEDSSFKDGPNVIGVQSLGASEIVLRVIGKTENGMQWAGERTLRKRLKEALDVNGIEIPYPHQVYMEKKADI
ncbi:mechanosensitive ion channel family protein [Aureibacillus halotolerans]|uniref:Small conductance mechanosensitive channel n=1 Tax=Aureibacillus halotolerans TaxID=1508390 RepID=A0A4R6UBB1_9BACI|nr:mechanosensitive ion channel family protein [Aureibacillus halotolerans]TDQ42249.1 small conductance mechanosensitive channel [Aureibacillus halotolerans]